MSVNPNNTRQTFIVQASIIASYLGLITWLLFLVFNTKSLNEVALFKNYFALFLSALFIFKFSSAIRFEA